MPDLDDDLIRQLAFLGEDDGTGRAAVCARAAARLTAAAEERDALEANRSNGWAAANAEIAKRERAEASLIAARQVAANLQHEATGHRVALTAAEERERLLTRLLRECQQTGAIGEYLDAAIDETFDMFAASPADRAESGPSADAEQDEWSLLPEDGLRPFAAQPPDEDERDALIRQRDGLIYALQECANAGIVARDALAALGTTP